MKTCKFIFLILICAVFRGTTGTSSPEISSKTTDPNCFPNSIDKSLCDNSDLGIGGKAVENSDGVTEQPEQTSSLPTNTVSSILSEILSSSYDSNVFSTISATVASILATAPSSCSGNWYSVELSVEQIVQQLAAMFQKLFETFFSALGIINDE